jgi:hypothetical protein
MELEFDKEIDGLLRSSKPRDATGASLTSASAAVNHLDVDEVAAFAENAVPGPARLAYVNHVADCESCRQRLAFAASLAPEIEIESKAAAPAAIESVPWYRQLFRTPGLAVALGALVIAFGGAFIYMILPGGSESNVAAVIDTNRSAVSHGPSDPVATEEFSGATANTSVNSAVNTMAAARPAMNSNMAAPGPVVSANTAARQDTFSLDGAEGDLKKSPAAPPPPPAAAASTADSVTVGAPLPEAKSDDRKRAAAEREISVAQVQQDRSRQALLDSPKMKTGPSRAQTQTQSQIQNLPRVEPLPSRRVRGRTFTRRDGIWYDAAFGGQPTIGVRRGTDAFRSLDGGLRDIASSLDGVVVAVWKGKAYRIQ